MMASPTARSAEAVRIPPPAPPTSGVASRAETADPKPGRVGGGGALAALMRSWRQQVANGYRNKDGFFWMVVHQMQGTRISFVCCLVLTAMAGLDVVLAENFKSMRVPFLVVVGGYSSWIGQVILLFRRDVVIRCFEDLSGVSDALEADDGINPRNVQAALRAEAAASRRRTKALLSYCVVSLVGSLGTMATDETLFTHRWARRHGGAALRWTKAAFDVYATLACHVSNFTCITMVHAVFNATATLYDAIGQELETQGGEAALRRAAALAGQLTQIRREFNDVFGRLLPHFLLVALLMPMVSTAEVLLTGGKADSFAVSTVPFILFEFMPFCLVGQLLEDSSEDMSLSAYKGPWLGESLGARRDRLMLVGAASRPAVFGLQGLVRLNRETSLDALRVWFQYLQVLLNVGGH